MGFYLGFGCSDEPPDGPVRAYGHEGREKTGLLPLRAAGEGNLGTMILYGDWP